MTPFPLKTDLILDARTVSLNGNVVSVAHANGDVTPYTFNNTSDAASAMNVINYAQINSSAPILLSITPNPFIFTTTTPITITGYGFLPANAYTLYLENDGNPDNNGWNMACTYVSTTQLTAVFGSRGDDIMDGLPVAIYLFNSTASKYSNIIFGSFNGDTISY